MNRNNRKWKVIRINYVTATSKWDALDLVREDATPDAFFAVEEQSKSWMERIFKQILG